MTKEELLGAKANLISQLLSVRVQKEGIEKELEKVMFALGVLEKAEAPKANAETKAEG